MNAPVSLAPAALIDGPGDRLHERRDWGQALAALRRLLADNQDTTQVFAIMRSLDGGRARANYRRLIGSGPIGARIAYQRQEFAERLMDDAWLDGFAPGTVGAAYRDFTRSERLSAGGLADVSKVGVAADQHDVADPVAWFARRMRDVHDLWHILTGYGRDPLGEACLVGFSYSQTKGLGWLAIAFGAMLTGGRRYRVTGVRAAILEGFRHGRSAAWLPGLDYERLMALPIDAARAELSIPVPRRYQAIIARHGALLAQLTG